MPERMPDLAAPGLRFAPFYTERGESFTAYFKQRDWNWFRRFRLVRSFTNTVRGRKKNRVTVSLFDLGGPQRVYTRSKLFAGMGNPAPTKTG
jgi:hypothetical protein